MLYKLAVAFAAAAFLMTPLAGFDVVHDGAVDFTSSLASSGLYAYQQ
jgi:hypothetical protein